MGPRVGFPNFYRTSPQWSGTPGHQPKVLIPGGAHINSSAFPLSSLPDAIQVVVGQAGAAAGATSVPITITLPTSEIPVNALDFPTSSTIRPIPPGLNLEFLTPGTNPPGKFARVMQVTYLNATTLVTEPLPLALNAGDTAYFTRTNRMYIQSGILVGRTYSERTAAIGYGPADITSDDEIHLLYFDIPDAYINNAAELYMANAGNVVYENMLPNWASLPPATQTWIRQHYNCIDTSVTEQVFI